MSDDLYSWDLRHLNAFWDFVTERQNVAVRRTLGAPPPWTADPVLASTFFTNVYREMDPGTQHLWLHPAHGQWAPHPADLCNLALYRLALYEGSQQVMGWLSRDYDATGADVYEHIIMGFLRCTQQGVRRFTNAYMVGSMGIAGPKEAVVAGVISTLWRHLHKGGYERALAGREQAMTELRTVRGIGGFVAYQALVDACYRQVAVLPHSNDGWVTCGPGAWRGLRLLYPGARRAWEQDLLDVLSTAQLTALGVRGFKYWRKGDMRGGALSKANLQNCLCEYSKYARAKEGGAVRRKYHPQRQEAAS